MRGGSTSTPGSSCRRGPTTCRYGCGCSGASRFGRAVSPATPAQSKIDELSRRGRGEPGNAEVSNVISAFGGNFTLRDGVLRLPGLRFSVRGARVDLDGRYSLRDQGLDFAGALRLDAPVSQTVTGFKSILLKPIDPLFRRNGAGTLLPIRISGTVNQPNFGVDAKKVFSRD